MPHDPVPALLSRATELLEAEFAALPEFAQKFDQEATAQVLAAVANRLGDNYPYFHPLYAGQMLKPPHPLARAAYGQTMNINPNNHARDGGRASSEMEIEAVGQIASMFGWTEYLGHLTSSGTLANQIGTLPPTTTPGTAGGPARRWRSRQLAKSPPCSAGRNIWGTSPPAALSPISKRCGPQGSRSPAVELSGRSKRTTLTGAFRRCSSWSTWRFQPTTAGA